MRFKAIFMGGTWGNFEGWVYILNGGCSHPFHITIFPYMLKFPKIVGEMFVNIIRVDYFSGIIKTGKPTNHKTQIKPQTTNHEQTKSKKSVQSKRMGNEER